jgi:quinoprotein glucose dehydrogenase
MTQLVRPLCYGFLIVSSFVVSTTPAQQGARNGEWRTYGGDEGSTRYSSLDQINRDNIKNMRVAWVWRSDSLLPSAQPTSETTPIHGERRPVLHDGSTTLS